MNPADMFQRDNPYGDQQLKEPDVTSRWRQARGELLGFAAALDRKNAEITAAQIRLAVALADTSEVIE